MRVWITVFAIVVCAWGAYRIWLALRPKAPPEDDDGGPRRRRGLQAMAPRTHFLVGVVYLLLGGALIATAFGWNPLASMYGPKTAPPAKGAAPTKTPIPVDQLPQPK